MMIKIQHVYSYLKASDLYIWTQIFNNIKVYNLLK